MLMETIKTGVAKRLILSLVLLFSIGGCAVYAPPPPAYSYFDSNGQTVYVTPQVVPAPVYVNPGYVWPPVFFNFGFNSWGGRGYYGGRGYHGGGRGRWR